DESDVDDRRAVDADEPPMVELVFQLDHRVIDDVFAAAGDGERELLLGKKVRDAGDVDDPRALANARGDPFEPASRRELSGQLLRERADVRRALAAETLQLVERLF